MLSPRRRLAAFTLIEMMVVVALMAIVITLAAPSFREMILMRRLRGVNAQAVTDIAYARSEAVSRGTFVQVRFRQTAGMSCYVIYTRNNAAETPHCDCSAAEGSRCTDPTLTEVRTVQLANADSVVVSEYPGGPVFFTYNPRTGGLIAPPNDIPAIPPGAFVVESYIDDARKFRDIVNASGRVSVCAPTGSRVGGEACP